jgi:geranylgeranylglycerol-phosphate geranylgeranyltransferase
LGILIGWLSIYSGQKISYGVRVLGLKFFSAVKTFLDLMRVRNAVISFLGVFVGAVVFSLGWPQNIWNVLAAAASAAFILGGGNILNDYFDLEIDRVNQPKRPLPSGRITKSDAFMVALALFLAGLGFAKSINNYCLSIAAFNTFLLIIYARYSKKLLFVANICISYLVASVFIYGAATVYSPMQGLNPDGVKLGAILLACSFLLNLSRELVKDIEDMEGDQKSYSLTVPLRYGAETAKIIAIASSLAAVVISLAPLASDTRGFNELIYGLFIGITDLTILASYTTSPTLNQRILVLGMSMALIAFLLGVTVTQYAHPAGI